MKSKKNFNPSYVKLEIPKTRKESWNIWEKTANAIKTHTQKNNLVSNKIEFKTKLILNSIS